MCTIAVGAEVDLAEGGQVVHMIERDGVVGVYSVIAHKDEVGLIGSTAQSSGQLRRKQSSLSEGGQQGSAGVLTSPRMKLAAP
eukprot:scaffold655_cov211-Ochromonas_danica.AAC.5